MPRNSLSVLAFPEQLFLAHVVKPHCGLDTCQQPPLEAHQGAWNAVHLLQPTLLCESLCGEACDDKQTTACSCRQLTRVLCSRVRLRPPSPMAYIRIKPSACTSITRPPISIGATGRLQHAAPARSFNVQECYVLPRIPSAWRGLKVRPCAVPTARYMPALPGVSNRTSEMHVAPCGANNRRMSQGGRARCNVT